MGTEQMGNFQEGELAPENPEEQEENLKIESKKEVVENGESFKEEEKELKNENIQDLFEKSGFIEKTKNLVAELNHRDIEDMNQFIDCEALNSSLERLENVLNEQEVSEADLKLALEAVAESLVSGHYSRNGAINEDPDSLKIIRDNIGTIKGAIEELKSSAINLKATLQEIKTVCEKQENRIERGLIAIRQYNKN